MSDLYDVVIDALDNGTEPDEQTIASLIDTGPTKQRAQQRKLLVNYIGSLLAERNSGDMVNARAAARKTLDRFSAWNESAASNPRQLVDERTAWGGEDDEFDHDAAANLRTLLDAAAQGERIVDADIESLTTRDSLTKEQRAEWLKEVRASLDEVRTTARPGNGLHNNGVARSLARSEYVRLGVAMGEPVESRRLLDDADPAELAAAIPRG